MQKKAYTPAEMQIKRFAEEEVIVASANTEPELPSQDNDDLPIL